ncbi:DNA-3-methyladenine glycosylase [Nocardioides zeae]|uniref:Putative 3-methyladenine DNA glycosylase n=1 Tax=Nocardioides imazamoxiresistens TaxID=3231893 RepID=A0ABU3PZJ4_9ACTN|nr:DNA-3-methyladenine glycosylase [Nocardioides zeae]MDT9594688.1 DNA-3-methyladenine glycosylase [Nocardioides zeae]
MTTSGLRDELTQPVEQAAVALLGCAVVAGPVRVRITEVEAYDGETDPASHAWRGPTDRNRTMFGPAGHAYVYLSYGMHHCLNVVAGHEGHGCGVLLRAGEVVAGHDVVGRVRPEVPPQRWARGPGLLTRCLGVDRSFDGTDLLAGTGPLRLERHDTPDPEMILAGPRVGVGREQERPWRFFLAGDPTVSSYRRQTPRRRTSS